MKARKHMVVAGASAADVAEIRTFMRVVQAQLDHTWACASDDDAIDFVVCDLADFGGRCARIRALDEGKHFAVLASAGEDALGAELVLDRLLTAKSLVGMLNHVGCAAAPRPRRLIDFSAYEREITPLARKGARCNDGSTASGGLVSSRATFLDIERERPCTDLDALIKHGAVLLQRSGIAPLLVDPITDTFCTTARLRELEPYFLEPLAAHERKRVGGAQLAALRKEYPPRPLVRLRWLRAFLRSNGWLAERLDPGANYQLNRWLPLDNDYRKQHRIALTLMREAPLHRIAAKAKANMADVFDVVNAYHALGLIECRRQAIYEPQLQAAQQRRRSTKKTRQLLEATELAR